MIDSILLFLMVTIGAFISGLTGIGGGSLVLAGLMFIYPAGQAIPLHAFNQLAANGLRAILSWRQINYKVMLAYFFLLFPGCYLAAYLFPFVNSSWVKVLVGFIIILSAFPKIDYVKSTPSLFIFSILGFFSGFISMFSGAIGPLVLPFFNKLKGSRESLLGTKSGSQLLLQIVKIIAFSKMMNVEFLEHKSTMAILVIGTFLGIGLSLWALKKVTNTQLDKVVMGLMLLSGGKILFEGISGLIVSFH